MVLEWLRSLNGEAVVSGLLDVLSVCLGLFILGVLAVVSIKLYFTAVWHLRQFRWRRDPKVGDRALFYNVGGGLTVGEVKAVSEDRLKVSLYSTHGRGFSNCWYDVKNLFHLTKEEADYIYDQKLQALFKKTKGVK